MNGEKFVWEEDLSFTFAEEYKALVNTIRFSEGFSLLFVECSPAQGTKIMEKIRRDIPRERAEVLALDESVYNFYNRVENLPNLKKIDILFVTGLEYSLYEYEDEMRARGLDEKEVISISKRGVPRVLINLNQQRERFRDNFDICFVFLLPRFAMDYLINRSPDFFDWRSGVFRFPMDKENLEYETFHTYYKRIGKEDYETLTPQECKKELIVIQSLIDEDNQTLEKKVDLLIEQGRLNNSIGKKLEAIAAYDKALEIKPDYYYAWNNKGNTLSDLGRYEEAISAYDKALGIKQNSHDSWIFKGNSLSDLGRYEEAISAYDKALEVKPDDDESWLLKGNALINLEKYEQAISAYDKALEIKPDQDEACFYKGNALINLGKYEQAIAAYEKAIEIKSDSHTAWYNKGHVLSSLGRHEQAIYAFDKAVEIEPNCHQAWNSKGYSLSYLGKYEEAISACEKVLEIKPEYHYNTWQNKGILLIKLGIYEEAIAAFDQALEINPDYYQAWYFRGVALIKLRRFQEGNASVMKSLEINPDFDEEIYSQMIKNLLTKIGWYKLKEIFTRLWRFMGLIN
ncbi:MAG: tetratricopeptide repeat protein [Okeania sp. SIO3I5]|uniref:tetratricopeptide repeat protein n=1 Tax=Okeania sp. SIO3I5 TaxID=2607805 RepID=UPI0013BA0645|nr:tetratricopeptide repeat protein [Okeania sp. SIO3I5]NEQ36182.1 tetratricopeptide repeat protein [Okeania sp. SIO3I5]